MVGGYDYVARIDTAGNLEAGFHPVLSSNGIVNCLAVQPDGRVVIGGTFTSVNGTNRHNIARLNSFVRMQCW